MENSINLGNTNLHDKKIFCRNHGIPINVYWDEVFEERLLLLDSFYGTVSKWYTYLDSLDKYPNFSFRELKDSVVDEIRSTDGFQRFNSMDMQAFSNNGRTEIPKKGIYSIENIGKSFASLDMVSANFNALRFFDKDIFKGHEMWMEYLSEFTQNEHYLSSKYVRQSIFGSLNSKRITTYQKYLTSRVIEYFSNYIDRENFKFASADEFVIELDKGVTVEKVKRIFEGIGAINTIPWKLEVFKLEYLSGVNGYLKVHEDGHHTIKCLSPEYVPFVIRKLKGITPTEYDHIVDHNGIPAKLLETPLVERVCSL